MPRAHKTVSSNPVEVAWKMTGYANWHSGDGHAAHGARSLVPVGSSPTSVTVRLSVSPLKYRGIPARLWLLVRGRRRGSRFVPRTPPVQMLWSGAFPCARRLHPPIAGCSGWRPLLAFREGGYPWRAPGVVSATGGWFRLVQAGPVRPALDNAKPGNETQIRLVAALRSR